MRVFLIAVLFIVLTLAGAVYLPLGTLFDAALIEASTSAAVLRFPLSLAALAIALRTLDYTGGINFLKAWDGLTNAHAVYLGARFVGVCILLAAIFG